MRIATYHRVSTDEQNPEGSRADLLAWVQAGGHTLVEQIEETGSGADNDRPGLDRTRELARAHAIDGLAVWKLDRYGRSVLDLLTNVGVLNESGVTLMATSQGLVLGPAADPVQKLNGTMLAALAEYELAMIRERTRQAMAARKRAIREKGGFTGKRSGVWRTRLGRPSLSAEDQGRIRQARTEGLNAYWASKRLGLAQSTVRRYMAKLAAEEASTKKGPPKEEGESGRE